jgi:hypothetical protein
MAQKIDFGGLLTDLFQEKVPIEEKVQERPKNKRDGADFSKALGEIFQAAQNDSGVDFSKTSEKNTGSTDINKAVISSLQACNLYVFMRKIVMERFGMGLDYSISDRNGNPIKSWFTIQEAIEAAESQGYRLSVTECKGYLEHLIKKRYIETDDYKYRRCVLWDKDMELYLQHYL